MVTVPIYSDSEFASCVCDCCKKKVSDRIELIPCLNTATNMPVQACQKCQEENNHIIPLDECMPSGDVVM